ncbi:iron ABC transporter permease [Citricoccus sp.]|uniref:ABC transporter permease n=1 Tax=Citricoccus sp. TaxID=1978372 RepID=UPI002624E96A|nr:iron ABC transporter permease [Citricoccus sp.]HRO29828.1 iron ABC transporter permease [Citricoccus sp.]HRO93730.1 iron ABC transporter permease [Citricoccus sp.]
MNRLRSAQPALLLFLLFIAAFFGYPLLMLVYGAFRSGQPGTAGEFGLSGFVNAYGDPATWSTLWASVLYALGVQAIGIVGGFVLAWLATRTNTPGSRTITITMVTIFAIPTLFFAISWGMLTGPTGLVTQVLGTGPDGQVRFDALSWAGLILVSGLKSVAVMYLLLMGPVRALNRSMEEASLLSGAGRVRTFLEINIPILLPTLSGLAILGFVNSLGQLDVALILGVPAGIYVFPTQIYDFLATTPIRYDSASALALLLIAIIYLLVMIRSKALGNRNFITVTGKAYRVEREDIGRWRWAGLALFLVYAAVALILPLVQLVIGSLQPILGVTGFTLRHYTELLTTPSVLRALQNTFFVGILAGFFATVLAVVISYVALRSKHRLSKVPELIVWAVVAVPGIVLALAITWAYLSVPGLRTLYGSVWIVLIALVIVVTPIAQRATSGPVGQLAVELEESARVSGASPVRMMTSIVVPLIGPTFLASWFITGVMAAGSLDIPILLSSTKTETVSLLVYNYYTQLGNGSRAAALLLLLLALLAVGGAILLGAGRLLRWRSERRTRSRGDLVAAVRPPSGTARTAALPHPTPTPDDARAVSAAGTR